VIEFLFNFGFKSFFIIFCLAIIIPIIISVAGGIMLLFGSDSSSAEVHVEKIQTPRLREQISIKRIFKLLGIVIGLMILLTSLFTIFGAYP